MAGDVSRAQQLFADGNPEEALAVVREFLKHNIGDASALDLIDEIERSREIARPSIHWQLVDDGSYRIVKQLGRGGFGEAFLAVDRAGRDVVVKELHSAEFAGRFQEEAKALTRFSHRSIVRVLQYGRWRSSSRAFYAMEYVNGKPLRTRLPARISSFRSEEAIRRRVITQDIGWVLAQVSVLADVARAIGHAHDRGFVHRDLKPENVIVPADGVAVVIDWGLVGRLGERFDGNAAAAATDPDTMAGYGTAYYSSPEQVRGEPASPAMDVYAIGAMLHELLCGYPPLADVADPKGVFAAMHAGTRPAAIAPSIVERLRPLAGLALRCVDPVANARPAIAAVIAELDAWAGLCFCRACTRIVSKTSARLWSQQDVVKEWRCSNCTDDARIHDRGASPSEVRGLFDDVDKPRPAAGVIPSGELVGTEGLVITRELSVTAGVRSILAHDDLLEKHVVIEELDAAASEDERGRFARVVDTLADWARLPVLPIVRRASAGRFVRDHVEGTPLLDAVGGFDNAAVTRGLQTVIAAGRGLSELQTRALAHGGLAPQHLRVTRDHQLVTAEWRGAHRDASSHAQSADVAALRDTVSLLLARHEAARCPIDPAGCPKVHHKTGAYWRLADTILELRASNPHPTRDLAHLVRAAEAVATTIACSSCGTVILQDQASIGADGLLCSDCAEIALKADVGRTIGDPIAAQRKRFVRWLVAAGIVFVGVLVPLFVVLARLDDIMPKEQLDTAESGLAAIMVLVGTTGVGCIAKAMFHYQDWRAAKLRASRTAARELVGAEGARKLADRKVAENIRNAGVFSLNASLAGMAMLFFPAMLAFVFGIGLEAAAAWAALYALRSLRAKHDERFTQHLAHSRLLVYATSLVGLAISGFLILAFIWSMTRLMGVKSPSEIDQSIQQLDR